MNALGEFVGGDSVRFTRLVAAPAARVWDYLTCSELLPEWLGNGEISSEVGGRVVLRSGGPVIEGKVLVRDPPRSLSYTWLPFIPGMETPMTGASVLGFALNARGENTELVLTQGPIAPELLSRSAAGWHGLLDILAAHIENAPPPDLFDIFHNVLPDYEKRATEV